MDRGCPRAVRRGPRRLAYARPLTVLEAYGAVRSPAGRRAQRARPGRALPTALPGGRLGAAARPGPRPGQQRDAGLGPADRPAGPALPRLRAGPAGLRRVGAAGRGRLLDPHAGRGGPRLHGGEGRPPGPRGRDLHGRVDRRAPGGGVTRTWWNASWWWTPPGCGPTGRPSRPRPSPARRGGRAAPRGRGAPQRPRPALLRGPRHPAPGGCARSGSSAGPSSRCETEGTGSTGPSVARTCRCSSCGVSRTRSSRSRTRPGSQPSSRTPSGWCSTAAATCPSPTARRRSTRRSSRSWPPETSRPALSRAQRLRPPPPRIPPPP